MSIRTCRFRFDEPRCSVAPSNALAAVVAEMAPATSVKQLGPLANLLLRNLGKTTSVFSDFRRACPGRNHNWPATGEGENPLPHSPSHSLREWEGEWGSRGHAVANQLSPRRDKPSGSGRAEFSEHQIPKLFFPRSLVTLGVSPTVALGGRLVNEPAICRGWLPVLPEIARSAAVRQVTRLAARRGEKSSYRD